MNRPSLNQPKIKGTQVIIEEAGDVGYKNILLLFYVTKNTKKQWSWKGEKLLKQMKQPNQEVN